MTELEFNKIIIDTFAYIRKQQKCYPCMRRGQLCYNYLYKRLRDNNLKTFENRSVDCFYLDENIEKFINALRNELFNKN